MTDSRCHVKAVTTFPFDESQALYRRVNWLAAARFIARMLARTCQLLPCFITTDAKDDMNKPNPFTENRVDVAALNVEIARVLKKRLDREAADRHISKRSIVEKALEAYFSPERHNERDALLARRLLNLDRRYEGISRQNKILAEAVAVFVQAWLAQNPELGPEEKGPASTQARMRYARFVERIARNFEQHSTLYDQLPEEVVMPVGPVANPAEKEAP